MDKVGAAVVVACAPGHVASVSGQNVVVAVTTSVVTAPRWHVVFSGAQDVTV